jgi:hypothetical protein
MHPKQFKAVAEMLDLLILRDPDGPAKPLAPTREQTAMLRLAQFEIGVHRGETELVLRARCRGSRLSHQRRIDCCALSLSKMVIRMETPLSPEFIVRAVAELSEIQARTKILQEMLLEAPAEVARMPRPFDFSWLLAVCLPGSLKTAANLNALWAALEVLDPGRRDILLRPLSSDPWMGLFLVDAVWLAETRSENPPDWTALLKALQNGFESAMRWRATGLAAAVATTTVRVLNENLQNPPEAFLFGRLAVRQVGWDARLVDTIADVCDWTRRSGQLIVSGAE